MSEDNKPKIDLKARLGKRTVGASGPSIPPPMHTGQAAPQFHPGQPQAPQMGGPGIPAPPFASRAPQMPAVSPSQPPRMEPAAIKIEMSEEVVEAQKKGRNKWLMVAGATALVGAVLGYAVGGGMARRTTQNLALQGAEALAGEIDTANAEVEKLADILTRAKRTLSDGAYPEKELNELGDVQIPFDAGHLVGKGTNLMSMDINRMLVTYAGQAQEANDAKDRLKRVMGGSKKAIEELLAQQTKPKFNWGVVMVNGANGPVASMQLLPAPFLVSEKWPESIEVQDGKDKVKLARYTKGEAVSSSPQFLPVDPGTQSAVCAADVTASVRSELMKIETLLSGDKSDPTNETRGLVDIGKALTDQLKRVGH